MYSVTPFAMDMSADGAITISDVVLWVKWLYFAPSDWVFYGLSTLVPWLSKFLEISPSSYSSFGAGILSFILWMMLAAMIVGLAEEIRTSAKAARLFLTSPEKRRSDWKSFKARLRKDIRAAILPIMAMVLSFAVILFIIWWNGIAV